MHKPTYLKYLLVLFFLCSATLGFCEKSRHPNYPEQGKSFFGKKKSKSVKHQSIDSHLWTRLTKRFILPEHTLNNKIVQHYVTKNRQQKYHFSQISKQASPYLYHVVTEVEKRNLPGELALLPMIESGFKPHAKSHVGAVGIWQINHITGKHIGLTTDIWHDMRFNIIDSTDAALTYLETLYEEFNQDWYLALAAYNVGPGRLRSAIRKNKRAGLNTDFWSLQLPKQTRHFVPKLIAMAHTIENAEHYNLQLEPIGNQPYFAMIEVDSQIDLTVVSKVTETPLNELRRLNPGYLQLTTHPHGPHVLLLPINKAKEFHQQLVALHPNQRIDRANYKIRQGDSLSMIAQRFNVSVKALKAANNLTSNKIIVGKSLTIPLTQQIAA